MMATNSPRGICEADAVERVDRRAVRIRPAVKFRGVLDADHAFFSAIFCTRLVVERAGDELDDLDLRVACARAPRLPPGRARPRCSRHP